MTFNDKRRLSGLVSMLAALGLAGCAASLSDASGSQVTAVTSMPAGPVTNEMLVEPPEASWLMFRGNHHSWGLSALDQIDRGNVGDLKLAWAVGMDPGSNQTTPVVHDGRLYLAHPNDVITAHDVTSGDLVWEYRHEDARLGSAVSFVGGAYDRLGVAKQSLRDSSKGRRLLSRTFSVHAVFRLQQLHKGCMKLSALGGIDVDQKIVDNTARAP